MFGDREYGLHIYPQNPAVLTSQQRTHDFETHGPDEAKKVTAQDQNGNKRQQEQQLP